MTENQFIPVDKFVCQICKHNFCHKQNLKDHMENVHEGLKISVQRNSQKKMVIVTDVVNFFHLHIFCLDKLFCDDI